jgi:hypothetical protein
MEDLYLKAELLGLNAIRNLSCPLKPRATVNLKTLLKSRFLFALWKTSPTRLNIQSNGQETSSKEFSLKGQLSASNTWRIQLNT